MSSIYLKETINRRARTLVTLQPIFELQRNAGAIDALVDCEIDVLRAAAEVLDVVITEMSSVGGISFEDLLRTVSPRIRTQSSKLTEDQIGRVVSYIVDTLMNQRGRYSFKLRYQHENDDGSMEWRENVFKLLKEEHDPAPPHSVRIEATDQAINLHLASFSVDIDAAQEAEEALVHHFVQHGRHKEAGIAAKRALDRSLQCRQQLRQLLRGVERHVARIDYTSEFKPALDAARTQLAERLSVEAKLLLMVEDRIPGAAAADRVDLVTARDLVLRAFAQHESLAAEVMQASQRFLEETVRQRFRRLPAAILADPWADIARPLLELPEADLNAWFFANPWTLFGVVAPRPPNLVELLNLMLREPEVDQYQGPEPAVEIVTIEEPERFTQEEYAQLVDVLRDLELPVTLGNALRAAEQRGVSENVQRLLVLQAGLWFVGSDEDQLAVTPLASPLVHERFYGRDLQLSRQ